MKQKNAFIFRIVFILLITFSESFSQNFQYIKYGGSTNSLTSNTPKEEVYDIATDSQRNTYVISPIGKSNITLNGLTITSHELNSNDIDMVLVSYTCEGAYRWHKVFWGGGPDYLSGVEVDSQDNVYVVGRFSQCSNPDSSNPYYSISRISDNNGVDFTANATNTSQNNCQLTFRAKFSSSGTFQWLHYLHAPIANAFLSSGFLRATYMVNDVLHVIATLKPGNYENNAISNTNTNVPFLYYLLKYDTSGTLISATPFDLQLSGYVSSTQPRWYRNPHNGYYYMVQSNNTASITMTAGGTTLNAALPKIICFNEAGQYQWHRQPSGSQISFTSIDFDSDNNVYVAGFANNFNVNSFLGWNLPGSNTGGASFIMKCNPDVTSYSWVTHHNIVAGTGGNAMLYTPSTLYYVGTIYNNPLTWGTQSIAGPGGNNSYDPLLARFNPATGACLGLQRVVGTNGYEDAFTHIEQDAAGDLLLGGFMGLTLTDSNGNASSSNGGNSDFFMAKYATQACQTLSTTSFEDQEVHLYPNPATHQIQIGITEEVSYNLYTVTGALIEKGTLDKTNNILAISHLARGCYLLQLKNASGSIKNAKILKE